MSNIKRLFKPKINRVITGLAIVVIIVVGSYLAYKNGVFADTSVSCTYTVTNLTPGTIYDSVYLADQANTNLVVANPHTTGFRFEHQFTSQGESFTSGANNYSAIIHKIGVNGTVTPKVSSANCTKSGTWEIAADLETGSIETRFYAAQTQPTDPPTGSTATTLCVAYPQGESTYMTFTYNSSTRVYTDVSGNRTIGLNSISSYTIDSTKCTATPNTNSGGDSQGGAPVGNGANQGGTTSADTLCVEYLKDSDKYATFTDEGVVWRNLSKTDQFIPSKNLGDYNQDDSGKKCSGGSNGDASQGGAPVGATTQTVPGCATGYSCYLAVKGETNFTCYKTGEPPSALYTLVPALANCTHQETTSATNPTSISGNEQNKKILVPTSGTQAAAVQYPNKINFTAYRESYAETNHVVPMGGATFNVQGFSSALPGVMNSVSGLQASATTNGITSASQAKCSTVNNFIAGTYGRLTNSYSRSFTTPDNGGKALYTQTLNVPPGYYRISYRKSGFGSTSTAEQTLCFQVGTNDGVSTPISINALLYAQPGAEPPGIMNPKFNGGIWYDNTVNSKDEYKTLIDKVPYKYMPDYPWQGWQKDDGTYNTGAPRGTMSDGTTIPGIPPNYGTGTNFQQYLSQCQNAGIQLGNIDRSILPWVGGVVAAADGIRDNDSLLGIAGRTLIGAGVGMAVGAILPDNSGVNVSINFGQYNAQCQALYNNVIPPQCQSCFINGVYNASTCPESCVQQVPFMQAMLQGNSSAFNFR